MMAQISMSTADWVHLFVYYLTLSLMSVGGAIATAPDMHRHLVVDQGWLTDLQFNNSIAIAQSAPGPNVLFVALFGWNIGMNAAGNAPGGWMLGLLGLFVCLLGVLLPSSTLTWVAIRWAQRHREREKGARAEGAAELGEIEPRPLVGFTGQEDRDEALGRGRDIGPVEPAIALAAAPLAQGEQPGQPRPGRAVRRIEEDRATVAKVDARPRDQPDAGCFLSRQTAHHAGDAAPVAKPEGRMAEGSGGREQFLGRRGPPQKGKMARGVEFDIGRNGVRHPNTPCMYQLRSPVLSVIASPRRKSQKRSPLVASTRK